MLEGGEPLFSEDLQKGPRKKDSDERHRKKKTQEKGKGRTERRRGRVEIASIAFYRVERMGVGADVLAGQGAKFSSRGGTMRLLVPFWRRVSWHAHCVGQG
jgi:hypothetical protein